MLDVANINSKCCGYRMLMLQTCDAGFCVEEEGESAPGGWMLHATRSQLGS
jgi:hypothetical protein